MDSSRAVRAVVFLALLIALASGARAATPAEKHALKAEHRPGELSRVEIALQVGGTLKLVTDNKPKDLPMSVIANLKYDEQLLALDAARRPNRSVRYYDDARAVIKVDQGGEKPALEVRHRLIVAERPPKSSPILYCPAAPLRREELDLIDVQGNTLIADQLLPETEVALGESWKLPDQALAELLGLEAVSWSDVQSVLGQIVEGVAEIAAAGSVSGAVGGVATEIELKAKYKFDTKAKRISFLALLVKEKRAVGHIGPGLDTVAKLIVTIHPLPKSEHLTEAVVRQIPKRSSPEATQLSYASLGGQFRFDYERRWYLTSDDSKLAVLRFLDRGELVAQCNVSALATGQKTALSLAEFQKDVQNSLGKNFGQFINASTNTDSAGNTVLRVVAHGTVSQLPITWIYYLIDDGNGQRVTLAFTFEQELESRFAQADRALVAGLRLNKAASTTAARPTRSVKKD